MPLLNPTAEPHVPAVFGKFADYVATKQVEAFPAATEKVQ
jgi:hypothetical protein